MRKRNYLIIIFIVCVLSLIFGFRGAGHFLVINEKPVKSDVIIMLSGGGIERLEKSVELYAQGYAPYLIISNGAEDNLAHAAQKMGVSSDVLILENDAKSTKENALFTKEVMEEYQFDSAIIVSSDFHMRRVKSNFTRAYANSPIRLTYISALDTGYQQEQWWKTKGNRQTTYIEYIKLVGNFFGIHGNKAKERLAKTELVD